MLLMDKAVFNISKKVLNTLIEKNSIFNTKTISIDNCKKCDFANNIHFADYCSNYCNKKTDKIIYVYDRNLSAIKHGKLRVPNNIGNRLRLNNRSFEYIKLRLTAKEHRFSELQIKQAILYYYLANGKGIVTSVAKKQIANALKCTVKAIEYNNAILSSFDLFEIKRHCAGELYIKIKDFENQYKKKGNGYMVFNTDVFRTILNNDLIKVNELKFILKICLNFDFNFKKNKKTTNFTLKQLKSILSNNFNHIKAIKGITSVITSIFGGLIIATERDDKNIEVVINPLVHGNYKVAVVKEENTSKIKKLMQDYKLIDKCKYYNEDILNDLLSLSLEYGMNLMYTAFSHIDDMSNNSIECVGAWIRNKLVKYMNIDKACRRLI